MQSRYGGNVMRAFFLRHFFYLFVDNKWNNVQMGAYKNHLRERLNTKFSSDSTKLFEDNDIVNSISRQGFNLSS